MKKKTPYERYEELRNKKGVTDSVVAKETGMYQSTFTDWKTGRSAPKADKRMKIAKYFDVPVEELL